MWAGPASASTGDVNNGSPEWTGARDEEMAVRTYWAQSQGSPVSIRGQREGLFMFLGKDLTEIAVRQFHHQKEAAAISPEKENEALEWCIQWGFTLDAMGATLLRRQPGQAARPVLDYPRTFEELNYQWIYLQEMVLLGAIGPFLFVQIHVYAAKCAERGNNRQEFRVVDLEKREIREVVQAGAAAQAAWHRFFDTPSNRRRMIPVMIQEIRKVGLEREADVRNLTLLSFHPVFDFEKERVRFRLWYEYRREDDCTGCHWEASILVDALPPDLAALVRPDPVSGPPYAALAVVSATLPEGWRIYGYTTLSAPPARVAELRKKFLSKE